MRGDIANADHAVTSADERRKAIEIALIVNVINAQNIDAGLLTPSREFGGGAPVLQIDK